MPAQSVQLVVTSPPYDNLRTYHGHCQWNFEATALELYRVLADGGVCCWNVGDAIVDGSETLTSFRQALFFKDKVGFRMHDTMIWQKVHIAAPNSRQYHQMFEYIFVLSKGPAKTLNFIEDRKNKYAGLKPFSYNSKRQVDGEMKRTGKHKERGAIKEMGRRTNVWTGNSRAQESPCKKLEHPAMMPKWLARDLILSWSNPGDTVLDPMCGSGTTLFEAEKAGRNSIGIDSNQSYVAAIQENIQVPSCT